MAGMIDPDKCEAAKLHLFLTTVNYFTSGGSVRDLVLGRPLNSFQKVGLPLALPASFLLSRIMPNKPFWYLNAVKQVWDDCDIGGGLKQKLQQFKASASEVIGKSVPAPAPIPVPVSAQLLAIELPTEWGQMAVATPGAILSYGGSGVVDQVMWGVAGAATLIYGGIVLTSALATATPASAPAIAAAAL